jgi:hypothetical protein
VSQAENEAQHLLEEYGLRAPLSESKLLQLLRWLDIAVGDVPAGLAGRAYHVGPCVLLQADLRGGRRLWAIAHELGHIVLGHVSADAGADHTLNWYHEREAGDFAGALLIGFAWMDYEQPWQVAEDLDLPEDEVCDWIRRQGIDVLGPSKSRGPGKGWT